MISSIKSEEDKKWDENIERILRIQIEENDEKVVTMSDGELYVTYIFDSSGTIKDCHVNRRRRINLGMLKYDVLFIDYYSTP